MLLYTIPSTLLSFTDSVFQVSRSPMAINLSDDMSPMSSFVLILCSAGMHVSRTTTAAQPT